MTDKDWPRVAPFAPSCVRPEQSAVNKWVVVVPQGVGPNDVPNPGYWNNHVHKFSQYANLEIWAADGSWWAEYRVLYVDPATKTMKLRLWDFKDLTKESEEIKDVEFANAVSFRGHAILFKGEADKWAVIRESDNEKIKAGFASRDEALGWIKKELTSTKAQFRRKAA